MEAPQKRWKANKQLIRFVGEVCEGVIGDGTKCDHITFAPRDWCPGCGEITFKPYIYKTFEGKEEISDDGLPSKKIVSHPLMHGSDGRIHSKCVPGMEKYLKYPMSATTSGVNLEDENGKTKEQAEEMIPVKSLDLVDSGNGRNGEEIHVAKLMEKLVEK